MVPYTALVVDASKIFRDTMSELLKGRGFNVEAVTSGEAALQYLTHRKVDVVFMDSMMPAIGGIEATQAILAQQTSCSLPVIICLEQEVQAERRLALQQGARDVLIKPVAGESLDQVLRRLAIDSRIACTTASTEKTLESSLARQAQTGDCGVEEKATFRPQALEADVYTVAREMAERVSAQWIEMLAAEVAKRVAKETAEVVSCRIANEMLEAAQELAERKAKRVAEMILVQASLEVASKAEEAVNAMVQNASAQAVTEYLKQQQVVFHKMLQEIAEQKINAVAEKQVAVAVDHYLRKLDKKKGSTSGAFE
jgi:twitching motility two-component system response regulator PilH